MTLICLIVEGIWLVLPELLLISMNIGLKHKVLVLVFLSTLAENKRTCVNFIKDFLIASTFWINVLSKSLSASSRTRVLTSCTLIFLLLISWCMRLGVPMIIAGLLDLIESICLDIFTSPINATDENVLSICAKISLSVLLTCIASSAVGTRITAWILWVLLFNLLIIGIRYASVLPVPVDEQAIISRLSIICLYVWRCISVISTILLSVR